MRGDASNLEEKEQFCFGDKMVSEYFSVSVEGMSFSSAPPTFPAWDGGVVIHDVGPKLSLNAEVEHELPRRVVNKCTRESRCSSAAAAVAHRDWLVSSLPRRATDGRGIPHILVGAG